MSATGSFSKRRLMCLHKELNLESLSRKLGLVSAFGGGWQCRNMWGGGAEEEVRLAWIYMEYYQHSFFGPLHILLLPRYHSMQLFRVTKFVLHPENQSSRLWMLSIGVEIKLCHWVPKVPFIMRRIDFTTVYFYLKYEKLSTGQSTMVKFHHNYQFMFL